MEDNDYLKELILSLVVQFACWDDAVGGYTTGGLSVLEEAFLVLGWEDPHPYPYHRCEEPGCMKQICCGWPDANGKYHRTCHVHNEFHQ